MSNNESNTNAENVNASVSPSVTPRTAINADVATTTVVTGFDPRGAVDATTGNVDAAKAPETNIPVAPESATDAVAPATESDVQSAPQGYVENLEKRVQSAWRPMRRAILREVEYIEVTVSKAFTLTDDQAVKHSFAIGVQQMDSEHAEHPYSIANGVVINE